MSEYVLSNIIAALPAGAGGNQFMSLFGERVYGSWGGNNSGIYGLGYMTDIKTISTDLPATFRGARINRATRVNQFGATWMLEVEKRAIWIDDMSRVLGETPPPLPNDNSWGTAEIPGVIRPITHDDEYLICENVVYCRGFKDPIELEGVRGGCRYNNTFVAWTPRVLFDVCAKKLIWVDPNCIYKDGQHSGRRINYFCGGCVYLTGYANNSALHWYAEIIPKKRKPATLPPKTCTKCDKEPLRFMTFGCGHSTICGDCYSKLAAIEGKKLCPDCGRGIEVAIPTIPR